MTTIGFIGAGHIGSEVARRALASGHDVVLSNSRDPETLAELIAELGSHASAARPAGAAAAADEIVVLATPLSALPTLPVAELDGKIVVDANNYYSQRDGVIPELEDGSITSSGRTQRTLPGSRVVKAFNHIHFKHIPRDASASGTPGRRALALYGDDPHAREVVAALLDEFGFDTVDAGPIAESWHIQPGTPGYTANDTAAELEAHLAEATR